MPARAGILARMHSTRRFAFVLPLSLVGLLPAQWPTTPTNAPVGDAANDQSVSKVAVTSDGGCYIGWFDNRSGGYAVYVQHLDSAGNELWPHGGMLISGNPQSSSLQDWDLICDNADHCVLAFTDTRAVGDLDVYAYRIAPNGTFVWGANGITLSTNPDAEANPHICQAGDGDLVFVWANTGTKTIQMQRIDAAGTVRFAGDGIAIPGDAGQTPAFARVVAGSPATGDVIVSWVRALSVTAAKHIHSQKYDALGNPLWNAGTRLPVFDQVSLPIAHDPMLISDGAGGALYSWHFAVGSQFFARVQRVNAAGTEVFPHNGVNVTTSTGSTFNPAAVWVPSTQEILVAWNERNIAQSNWGIRAQKLDSTGSPQWGSGVTLLPIDTTEKLAPVAAPLRAGPQNDGIAVSVLVTVANLQRHVYSFGLTNSGTPAWPNVVASNVSFDKLRLAQGSTPSGTQILAWSDLRSGAQDVYAAAIDARGQLGVQIATATISNCGTNNPAGSLVVSGRPAIGTTMTWALTNPVGTQAAGSIGAFFLAFATPGFPCGVPVPGIGMNGAGAAGDVSIDITLPYISFVSGVWGGVGTFVVQPFTMPFDGSLVGLPLWLQGLMADFAPGAIVPLGISEAAALVVGS